MLAHAGAQDATGAVKLRRQEFECQDHWVVVMVITMVMAMVMAVMMVTVMVLRYE